MANQLSCSEKTKYNMAQKLKELMSKNSFDKITVSDITNACGAHRQTFYYHFQDRYELLDWLIYNELLVPLMTDFSFDNMYDKLLVLFTTMSKDKKFYQHAFQVNGGDLTRYVSLVAVNDFTDIVIKLGKENGIDNEDKEAHQVVAEFLGYGISGVVMSWAQRGMKESPEEMTNRIEFFVESCKEVAKNR